VHDSTKAVFEERAVELDQITETAFRESKIGQNLAGMDRCECVDRFDFDDDTTSDKEDRFKQTRSERSMNRQGRVTTVRPTVSTPPGIASISL